MKRIGVIHATINSVKPLENDFKKLAPEYELINFVDEHMLKRLKSEGGITFEAKREFLKLLFRVVDAKVDAIIIACTAYCHLENLIREFTEIPVIPIDVPMLERAVETGSRIGVLATNMEAGTRAEEELLRLARKSRKDISVETLVFAEAFTALTNGDTERHDDILLQGAKALLNAGAEVVVLAQITMARAAELLESEKIAALSSPVEGILRIKSIWE